MSGTASSNGNGNGKLTGQQAVPLSLLVVLLMAGNGYFLTQQFGRIDKNEANAALALRNQDKLILIVERLEDGVEKNSRDIEGLKDFVRDRN